MVNKRGSRFRMVPMSSFAIKVFDKVLDWLPGIVAIALFSGSILACNAMFKGCERIEADQKTHFDAEGFVVESDVRVKDMGHLEVIHDTRRQVTCYRTYDNMSCLPDKDIKR